MIHRPETLFILQSVRDDPWHSSLLRDWSVLAGSLHGQHLDPHLVQSGFGLVEQLEGSGAKGAGPGARDGQEELLRRVDVAVHDGDGVHECGRTVFVQIGDDHAVDGALDHAGHRRGRVEQAGLQQIRQRLHQEGHQLWNFGYLGTLVRFRARALILRHASEGKQEEEEESPCLKRLM